MQSTFHYGYAAGTQANELTNTCLRNIGDFDAANTLGFIYATDALAPQMAELLRLLKKKTGIQHWVGTLGTAILHTGKEIYDRPALTIMLADLPQNSFRILPSLSGEMDLELLPLHAWIAQKMALFGVLHGDPTNPSTPTIISNLASNLEGGFFTGGLTSSQTEQLQVADSLCSGGVSGVLFSSELEVITGHTQGCTVVGGQHTITESQRNIIGKLDGRPALDVLKEEAGEVLARDLNRMGGYMFVGIPVANSDTGDYMVRNLIGIDVEQQLIAIGDQAVESSKIVFCRRDGNTAREDMLKMLESLKKRSDGRTILGGLYHSCLGRGRHQFGEDSEEVKMIGEVLGEFPLVGFFANGEIFHDRLYGYTGVLTLFLSPN